MNTPTPSQLSALRKATHLHKEQAILIQGSYGNDIDGVFKGSSIGCLAHDIDTEADVDSLHELVANHYGYPEWLAHLQDSLFKNADKDIHVKLPMAIVPRDNWKSVMHKIHWRILNDITLRHAGESAEVVKSVMHLHKTESQDAAAWRAAESAARAARRAAWRAVESAESAARSAARSAAESAARSASIAARSAAESAAWSAESAARSAVESAESAAWSAARSAAWQTLTAIVLEEVARESNT